MTREEEVAQLRAEKHALHAQLTHALEQIQTLQAALAAAQQRIAELEQQRPPPPFAKAKTPKRERKPRRKRAAEHNRGRRREPPTRIVQHALARCPDCHYRLRGHSIARRRQVIELPPPPPVTVTEHQVIKRWCPHCHRWRTPQLDLRGQVVGQGRLGVRITSLIAYLRTTLRLPIRLIRSYLQSLHGLTLSTGELVELLHRLRRVTATTVADLRTQARASPILHGDETGWREDGQHGYIWSFSSPGPHGIRYYEYDRSRSRLVVKRILGGTFQGVLSSDFYDAYNIYPGPHQRCWVHLLRDLHTLKERHAQELEVVQWAQAVRALYDEAQAWIQQPGLRTQAERTTRYARFVQQACTLGRQHAQHTAHPCRALAKRLLRHQDELFQFVLVDELSADNNLAERSLRPLVVMRKISGGTRSAAGSQTRMALASLFGTWQARGQNPFEECLKLLTQIALPQI
jgi:transposase